MKILKQIFFVTSLLFVINTVVLPPMTVKAQVSYSFSDSIYTSPPTLGGCDDSAGFKMVFKNISSDTLFSDTVSIFFADGVYWTGNTNGIIDTSLTTPFRLVYVFDTLKPNDSVVYLYHVRGYCSIILENVNTDSIHITFINKPDTFLIDTTNTYNIVSPFLHYSLDSAINMQYNGYFGENFIRIIPITNTGSFKYVGGQLIFTDSLGPAIRIDSIWAVLNTGTFGKVYTNLDNIVATDTLILPDSLGVDSTIFIFESVSVIGCLDSTHLSINYENGNSDIHCYWGCDLSYCESLQTIYAEVYRNGIRPHPILTILTPWNDSACEGSFKSWHLQFTDTSVVDAQHFSFE